MEGNAVPSDRLTETVVRSNNQDKDSHLGPHNGIDERRREILRGTT
jgi:hypothetical protein